MSGDAPQGGFTGRSVGGGRYVLRDLLGQGGMASVHLAHDNVLDRPVAVKTLHTNLGNEASFRERFRREAQSVAKLNHTNIVSVFDSGEDMIDGQMVPYIVMEYVEGKPLGDVLAADIAQFGAMPTDKALKITNDVLAALAVSHEMGLVHRDIKPGNVMITRRGVVKVMDFGIARAMQSGVTSMTQTGMVVGTPQYLSPEQALGRGVDERSDLYSVGCMLFELLTGRLPFDADSPLAMAYQHVQETPPAPSSVNQALGPAVDALVARALRKNPAERFPTADAMHDETERVLAATQSGAMPSISGTGVTGSRGEGVAQSVFPSQPAQMQTPAPQIQTPYAPNQQGYGPSTPPPSAYGYPQQGAQTPPPTPAYNLAPSQVPQQHPMGPGGPGGTGGPNGSRGGRSNTPLVVGVVVAVVAIAVIVGVIVAMSSSGGGSPSADDTKSPTGTPTSSVTTTASSSGIVQGDQTRTIETSECTDAHNDFINPDKPDVATMPNFQTDYVDSVVACVKAAGWKYTIKYTDEQLWGKGSVTSQSPSADEDYDPKADGPITIWVSTGKSAS
ncbi:Serine/threonine protein kinase [Actinacidiphila yanglinensis]|uniref:non-specific serine/threonine protein kinase n=1 Tax=Actinacidiphila yanglinensis TaxID=310779 RepID=A0A1H6A3B8_9ACTN|nr:Stk1 family PASTA domain-containing Ser/Thr kinase [Actinacidiphila yanglinensis]SEG42860.1 Serine/threonine protein kinase [Actinacidiphila yanglinensis]